MLLNWSILIVFLALGVIDIWVSYSFLNKNGLYLFCIVAVFLSLTLGSASMFGLEISVSTVLMPIVYFALLTCLHKFGKEEAKKMFFIVLITMTSLFICMFFEAAYASASQLNGTSLTWKNLGMFISPIISFAVASILTLFLTSKIKVKQLKNFLKLAMYIAIAGGIDVLICTPLVFVGLSSLGNILLIVLVKLVLTALVALGLGYFEKFLNREPKILEEVEKVEKPKKEESVEEIKTPDDID